MSHATVDEEILPLSEVVRHHDILAQHFLLLR